MEGTDGTFAPATAAPRFAAAGGPSRHRRSALSWPADEREVRRGTVHSLQAQHLSQRSQVCKRNPNLPRGLEQGSARKGVCRKSIRHESTRLFGRFPAAPGVSEGSVGRAHSQDDPAAVRLVVDKIAGRGRGNPKRVLTDVFRREGVVSGSTQGPKAGDRPMPIRREWR